MEVVLGGRFGGTFSEFLLTLGERDQAIVRERSEPYLLLIVKWRAFMEHSASRYRDNCKK
jgi:hypothetical protein